MADSTTFPTTIDASGNLKALVPVDAAPTAFQDWMQLISDAVSKIQIALGTTALPAGIPLPYCEVSDAAFGISSGTITTLCTTSTESVDTHGYHSDVTNPSRFTVPTGLGGRHLVASRASFAADPTGLRRINVRINAGSDITLWQVQATADSGATTVGSGFWMGTLAAADYIELRANQASGGSLNVTVPQYSIIRLGP